MRQFIIECLNPMDQLQDRSEASALEVMCRTLGHEVAPITYVQSKQQLLDACEFIASIDEAHDTNDKPKLPVCVHISAHGNEQGVVMGPKMLSWSELANAILPHGHLASYSGPLVVVISACDAGKQSLTVELMARKKNNPALRLPAYVFVTSDEVVHWRAAVASWTVFYYLIGDVKFNKRAEIRKVLETVRSIGGAVLRYYRWDDGGQKYKKYEPKE